MAPRSDNVSSMHSSVHNAAAGLARVTLAGENMWVAYLGSKLADQQPFFAMVHCATAKGKALIPPRLIKRALHSQGLPGDLCQNVPIVFSQMMTGVTHVLLKHVTVG